LHRNYSPSLAAAGRRRNRKPGPERCSQPQVTFNRDIAPFFIVLAFHAHRPARLAPFPADLCRCEIARAADRGGRQEPLHASLARRGRAEKFADELRLSEDEIVRIQAWVSKAQPREFPQLAADAEFVEGWQLGKPDVIVKATKPYALPANGSDNYWNFVFRTPVDRTRWLKAMEIRPGDKRLVHHANVWWTASRTVGAWSQNLARASPHGTDHRVRSF